MTQTTRPVADLQKQDRIIRRISRRFLIEIKKTQIVYILLDLIQKRVYNNARVKKIQLETPRCKDRELYPVLLLCCGNK
nr:MAG TPA: hypothetical protein [Bacteriophage sp.]